MFQKKKLFVAGIILALSLGAAACSGKNGGESASGGKEVKAGEELAPEFSYVAKYSSMPEEVDAYGMQVVGTTAYVLKYETNEADWSSTAKMVKMNFENGAFGSAQDLFTFDSNTHASGFTADANGNLYYVAETSPEMPDDLESEEDYNAYYENAQKNTKRFLIKVDANGQKVYETDLSDATKDLEYFYAQYVVADAQGRCYLYSYDAGTLLFDAEGKYAGKIDVNLNGYLNCMGMAKDGKVYGVIMDYSGEGPSVSVQEMDFDNKKMGKAYKGSFGGNGNMQIIPGKDCDLIVSDGNALYEYTFEKEEVNKILTWMDCDIDGSSVNKVFIDENGTFYAVVSDYNTGSADLAELTKVKTEEIAKRENIVIGVVYNDTELARRIVNFNKTNEQYRIKMKAYMDANDWSEKSYSDAIANLTNDISSGNGPDILDLSSLDIANLANKGVLEDLMPYLEKSTVLNKNDFFEKILSAATFNGKLTYVTSGFTLETLAAKTSIVGDRMGWTIEDMLAVGKKYPNAELLEYADRNTIMQMMMMLNKESYYDIANRSCSFDSKEFKDLLAFAKTFPEEYDYQNQRLTPFKLKDNSLILMNVGIYSFEEIQSTIAYFDGEPCTFIGYPSSNGGNGCILRPREQYGISSKSEHKDAAWAFIESVIAENVSDPWRTFGFSSLKSKYEEQKKKALTVEYVYDENGEIMKDDKGNPVYENGGGGYSMVGDNGETWDYVYKPVTAEEVDMVEKLLNGASVIDVSMDRELNTIIDEEAQSYFSGNKSVDDVASVIQSRVDLYLKENY